MMFIYNGNEKTVKKRKTTKKLGTRVVYQSSSSPQPKAHISNHGLLLPAHPTRRFGTKHIIMCARRVPGGPAFPGRVTRLGPAKPRSTWAGLGPTQAGHRLLRGVPTLVHGAPMPGSVSLAPPLTPPPRFTLSSLRPNFPPAAPLRIAHASHARSPPF